ncbi:hypothetical protein C8R43DRAFT_997767 [Mycena crocata]|nr:hypothetical protein C8R43DRAFT_997767 [Mycena crocata]
MQAKALRKGNSFASLRNFSPLHDAHNALWSALLPLTPFRAVTSADVATANAALAVWETAPESISILAYDNGKPGGAEGHRPSTNLLLVESMLRFCDYGAGLPDIDGADTEDLRKRFVRMKHHIALALLAEARSDERLERHERSDVQCDLDLVRDWATEIREELLNPGQRTLHWTHDTLPWILGYLAAWDGIEFSTLSESGITMVMKDIIHAPTIPVVSYMQPIRDSATSLLSRWASRPEAGALDPNEKTRLGLDIALEDPQPSNQHYSPPKILYQTGEIAQDFQELRDALSEANDDHPRVFHALDEIEAWEVEPLSAHGFNDLLARFQMTPGLRPTAEEVNNRMYSVIRKFSVPTDIQRRVTGFSYYPPPAAREAPFQLTFRDKNSLLGAHRTTALFSTDMPDDRTWQDVTVEASAMDPINLVFEQFTSTANSQHRHPLAPLTNFSIASTPDPFCTSAQVAEATKLLWEVSPGRFVQGRVQDLPLPEDHIVYYSRSTFNRVYFPGLTMKQPQERTLPPSCVPPTNWIRPSEPPGGEAVWECLPSLAFVGTGYDLYPGATSPPAIASYIYVPRSFEKLGIYPHAAYRREVTKDSTPTKLEPPLTVEQANAFLGRAIQYEVPVVPTPPLPANARPKKRRREDPPPVYWGVVWGVDVTDPAGLALRIFTGGQYQEAPATLKVGEACAVPTAPIDMTLPFTPKWVGAVSLVDASEEAPEPEVIPEEVQDRLADLLQLNSPQFEVGIDGNCVLLAGEIALHGIESNMVEKIENCSAGIWQGGRDIDLERETNQFVIWVHWVREGSIDLGQPLSNFATTTEGDTQAAVSQLNWTRLTTVSVDGGSMAILAQGLLSADSILTLTGNDDGDVEGFVECIVLHGAEDEGPFHIPGGVSSYTGGDGGFEVYTACDSEGKVVGVKITGD